MALHDKKDVWYDLGEPQWTPGGEVRISKTMHVDGKAMLMPDIVRSREWALEAMGLDLYAAVGQRIIGKLMLEGEVSGEYVSAVGDMPAPVEPPAPAEPEQLPSPRVTEG